MSNLKFSMWDVAVPGFQTPTKAGTAPGLSTQPGMSSFGVQPGGTAPGAPRKGLSPAPAASTGFSLPGAGSAPAASTGFSLPGAGSAPAASTGFSLPGAGSAPAASTGFSLPGAGSAPAASTGFSLPGAGSAPAASTGFSLPGAGSAPAASTGFSMPGTASTTQGTAPAAGTGFALPGTAATQAPQKPISTKSLYIELPPQLRQRLDGIERYIKSQADTADRVARSDWSSVTKTEKETSALRSSVASLANALDRDLAVSREFKKDVAGALKHSELAARSLERIKAGAPVQMPQDLPSPYFWSMLEEFERRMYQYRARLEEIEAHMDTSTPSGSSGLSPASFSPTVLQDVLRNQHEYFMAVATEVAGLHESISDQRDRFLSYLKKYRPGAADPFEKAARLAAKSKSVGGSKKSTTAPVKTTVPIQPGQPGAQLAQATGMAGYGGTTGFGTKPFGGFGSGFGAKPAGSFAGFGSGFSSKPAASFGGFGSASAPAATGGFGGFGAKPAATLGGFGATGLGATAPASTPALASGFGSAPAPPPPLSLASPPAIGTSFGARKNPGLSVVTPPSAPNSTPILNSTRDVGALSPPPTLQPPPAPRFGARTSR